ncbi:MAG: hypothetical protein ACI4JY_09925 [Oscillospiraceae bacterium]
MKSKTKTVAATMVLVLASVMSYYILALAYIGMGGAIYSINNGSFSAQDLGYLGLSLLMLVGFLAAYIVSVVYLCKQLFAIKKWMVVIPIIASVLIAMLGILLIWANFQFE